MLMKTPVKILVLCASLGLLGVNIWGATMLEQEFDFIWMYPTDSYIYKYSVELEKQYPESGEVGFVFFGAVDYPVELETIEEVTKALEEATDILVGVTSWSAPLYNFINEKDSPISSEEFNQHLSDFLWSSNGFAFQNLFWFDGNLTCGQPAPQITASAITFTFRQFDGSSEHIPAMNKVKDIVSSFQMTTGDKFMQPWSMAFGTWEIDELIGFELLKNMLLATASVFVITMVLIVNPVTVMMVLLCVVMTMVDVAGTMYFLGLTIETVSLINLVLGVGLSIDYSAHIGYTWMTTSGSRNERLEETLTSMAIPVFNGGFSTFLAIIAVIAADSYTFTTFVKIFSFVVVYGQFHGLVFLPVLLNLMGPAPYKTAYQRRQSTKTNKNLSHQDKNETSNEQNTVYGQSYQNNAFDE